MRVAVINLKGGVAKSLTVGHLAYGLAQRGQTLVIDADAMNQSLLHWKRLNPDLPFEVVAPANLESAPDWEHLVIDTPPFDAAAVRAALSLADVAVVPVSPNMIEVGQIGPTQALFAEEKARRGRGKREQLREFYVLTSVRRTNDAGEVRAYLAGEGLPVMTAEVPLSVHIARAFGGEPYMGGVEPGKGYAAVLKELLGE